MINLKIINSVFVILFFWSCEPPDEKKDEETTGDETTLSNCDESFGSGVPAFYSTYFSCVDVSASGSNTTITSDNLPPYKSWYYSKNHENYIDYVSQGSGYFQNPNEISGQSMSVSVPNSPTSRGLTINSSLVDGYVGTSNYEYGMGAVGVTLNGVALFNPLAAPPDDIEDEKFSFDYYNGHPTNTGYYHYHTTSKGPLEVLQEKGLITTAIVGSGEIELYGIMCDGTVIMGCTELDGITPDDNDFDSQNGHVHDIEDGTTAHFTNRYHTHICTASFTGFKFTPEIQYYDGCN